MNHQVRQTTYYWIVCNHCESEGPYEHSVSDAFDAARAEGWETDGSGDKALVCERCSDGPDEPGTDYSDAQAAEDRGVREWEAKRRF